MKSKSNASESLTFPSNASQPSPRYALPKWLVEDVIFKEWPERRAQKDTTEDRSH